MERRSERADTAYSPSGRSWREELELENGGQIPLLFLLYFVAKNKNQPQRTVDDRSERFGGFWGEAFGHRRRLPHYNGSAIRTVVPSPILLDIVILPPSSAVRRSMPESP